MEGRLQRRVHRYGWDLAAAGDESLWQTQLACAQTELIACASLAPGERVLDVACGSKTTDFHEVLLSRLSHQVRRHGLLAGADAFTVIGAQAPERQ
jgi:hypothetical protein